MNNLKKYFLLLVRPALFLTLMLSGIFMIAQNGSDSVQAKVRKPVKSTFESNWIQDNQSVMIPIKGTLEMDIQHRFGTVNNGYKDFIGIYAPSNIRIGFSYVVINNLQGGFGFTKDRMQWDFNVKYALLKQTRPMGIPVSITYFGNAVVDTRPKENFVTNGDRLSYFHQLIIAMKITDAFSVQAAPSLSHYNNVEGYLDEYGKIQKKMLNDHWAIACMGRYKVSSKLNVLVNYDQPLTQHPFNNPHPNISFGIEIVTSSHAFQIFMGNYHGIVPQSNNFFNQNDYTKGQFLIGFNITKLWNF
jgi:hypothetical protein